MQRELISAPKAIKFLSNPLPLDNKKLLGVSNPIPYLEYLYLSKPIAFLVNLTTPKQELT